MPDSEPVHEHPSRGLDHGAWVPLKIMYPRRRHPGAAAEPADRTTRDRLLALGRAAAPPARAGRARHRLGLHDPRAAVHRLETHLRPACPAGPSDFDAWAADALARGDVDELARFRSRAPGHALRPPDGRALHAAVRHPRRGHRPDGTGRPRPSTATRSAWPSGPSRPPEVAPAGDVVPSTPSGRLNPFLATSHQDGFHSGQVVPSAQTTSPVRPGRVRSQRAASRPWRRRRWRRCRPRSARRRRRSPRRRRSAAAPVRASTRCCPRCAVPEVATAPVRTGTTARTRRGSCGSSMPIRHGGAVGVGGPADHVATGREAEVGVRQRAQRRGRALTAQPFTTPLGSSTARRPGRAAYVERAARLAPRPLARARAPRRPPAGSPPGRSRRGRAGRRPSRPVGAEDPVHLPQLGHRPAQAARATSSSACRPRSARLIGIPMTCST